jgi:hypothetical protein
MERFRLNPAARLQLRRLGREQVPLLIIDDLMLEPEVLVDQAATGHWGEPDGTYYPGLNAPAPEGYMRALHAGLQGSFVRAFGQAFAGDLAAHGFFALATWGLDQFGPWQRIPHYDQPDPHHLAMVHYLSPFQGGGTGFFRHLATDFEYVDQARRGGYLAEVTGWLDGHGGELTGYCGAETPGYQMFDQVEFRFNRAVIYPSFVLHCALFEGATLDPDPLKGRLTLNSFFSPD